MPHVSDQVQAAPAANRIFISIKESAIQNLNVHQELTGTKKTGSVHLALPNVRNVLIKKIIAQFVKMDIENFMIRKAIFTHAMNHAHQGLIPQVQENHAKIAPKVALLVIAKNV